MKPTNLPKELLELTLHDKRPAYLFIDRRGHFPLTEKMREGEICIYCANPVNEDKTCTCSEFRTAAEYNDSLESSCKK